MSVRALMGGRVDMVCADGLGYGQAASDQMLRERSAATAAAAEGFGIPNDAGATDAVVDVAETDRLVPVLVTECKESPKLTLWQKLKRYF